MFCALQRNLLRVRKSLPKEKQINYVLSLYMKIYLRQKSWTIFIYITSNSKGILFSIFPLVNWQFILPIYFLNFSFPCVLLNAAYNNLLAVIKKLSMTHFTWKYKYSIYLFFRYSKAIKLFPNNFCKWYQANSVILESETALGSQREEWESVLQRQTDLFWLDHFQLTCTAWSK